MQSVSYEDAFTAMHGLGSSATASTVARKPASPTFAMHWQSFWQEQLASPPSASQLTATREAP